MKVTAIQPFEHDGTRRIGDGFEVADHIAKRLKEKGLVEIVGQEGAKTAETVKTPDRKAVASKG